MPYQPPKRPLIYLFDFIESWSAKYNCHQVNLKYLKGICSVTFSDEDPTLALLHKLKNALHRAHPSEIASSILIKPKPLTLTKFLELIEQLREHKHLTLTSIHSDTPLPEKIAALLKLTGVILIQQ